MRKLQFSFIAVLAAAGSVVFAVAACVGDDPASATGTVAEGQLGGPCFANGTCNQGLTCGVVQGAAQCVSANGDPVGNPTSDASSTNPTSGDSTTDAGDSGSGTLSCTFQPTAYPCKQPENPTTVCYGAAQSCTATGCGPGEISWMCNSPRQCNDGPPCCVPAEAATFTPDVNCTQGSLLITAGATTGAACSQTTTCPAGSTQLCQANGDCPKNMHCVPVKVSGAPASFNGTILGACTP